MTDTVHNPDDQLNELIRQSIGRISGFGEVDDATTAAAAARCLAVAAKRARVATRRRRALVAVALLATITGVAVLAWLHTPPPPSPVPELPQAEPTGATRPPDADYDFDVTGDVRTLGPLPVLLSGADYAVKKRFPAGGYRHAWLVQFGPHAEATVLAKLPRDGDTFVADCPFKTGHGMGFVLITVVLSREPSPTLDAAADRAVPCSFSTLEDLRRYYSNPRANAAAIEQTTARLVGVLGVPSDSRIHARPFKQLGTLP